MNPRVVIYYMRSETRTRPAEKIAKAAFVDASDALIYWQALSESRKQYLRMETVDGQEVTEVAHTGFNDASWGGYYSHAQALTEKQALPPRTTDRTDAQRRGWEFESVGTR